MCDGCGELTGFPLDVYAAALRLPANERRQFVDDCEIGYVQHGLVDLLVPLLDQHAED